MSRARFVELARTFHSIRDIDPRFEVWGLARDRSTVLDLHRLDDYGAVFAGEGGKHAVAFLLNLWSTHEPWRSGAFNVFKALVAWDDGHRAAWQAWAADPWRP